MIRKMLGVLVGAMLASPLLLVFAATASAETYECSKVGWALCVEHYWGAKGKEILLTVVESGSGSKVVATETEPETETELEKVAIYTGTADTAPSHAHWATPNGWLPGETPSEETWPEENAAAPVEELPTAVFTAMGNVFAVVSGSIVNVFFGMLIVSLGLVLIRRII